MCFLASFLGDMKLHEQLLTALYIRESHRGGRWGVHMVMVGAFLWSRRECSCHSIQVMMEDSIISPPQLRGIGEMKAILRKQKFFFRVMVFVYSEFKSSHFYLCSTTALAERCTLHSSLNHTMAKA